MLGREFGNVVWKSSWGEGFGFVLWMCCIACTWWANIMLTLQKPLSCGTTQCLFCRNSYWKVASSVVPNFTSSAGGQVWLWGWPPGIPKENPRIEECLHRLISGKSLSMYVYSRKTDEYVSKDKHTNRNFSCTQHAPFLEEISLHASGWIKNACFLMLHWC